MDDKKNIEELFDSLIRDVDRLHKSFVDTAKILGYSKESLINSKSFWTGLYEASQKDASLVPIINSGTNILTSLNTELINVSGGLDSYIKVLSASAGTVDSFIASSAVTSSVVTINGLKEINYEPNPFINKEKELSSDRFSKLDLSLGDTFRQLEETLYATRSDKERAALFLIRQSFDHLFEILAPDEKVRSSKYWKLKKGEKPDQVYRIERIEYAAHTHITDLLRANTLAATSKQMIEIYKLLNHAHERGELNVEKADKALKAMKSMLDDWADSLGL